MKNIVSIYVSIFLVFSTSFGQTQNILLRLEGKFYLALSSGEVVRTEKLIEIKGDSLIVETGGMEQTIAIMSISKLTIEKKDKMLVGGILGSLVGFAGVFAGYYIVLGSIGGSISTDGGEGIKIAGKYGLPGGFVLGAAIGHIPGKDKIYDFSELNILEKKEKIESLKDVNR